MNSEKQLLEITSLAKRTSNSGPIHTKKAPSWKKSAEICCKVKICNGGELSSRNL